MEVVVKIAFNTIQNEDEDGRGKGRLDDGYQNLVI